MVCMQLDIRKRLLLLLFLFFGGQFLIAQEFIHSDASLPHISANGFQKQSQPNLSPLRTTTLSLPFLDDFSGDGQFPDTLFWAIHPNDQRRPLISTQKGKRVPSKGLATFDGANMLGRFYSEDLSAGMSDTLTSQPINLAGKTAADSIYLSFFVQRGGTGEAPEALDSLVVLFDSTGDFEYKKVWALRGTGASDTSFQYFHIPVTNPVFFHANFRMKFVGYTSLNGELDQFHLDYVYLNSGRSISDSQLNDISPSRHTVSPFAPWTAVPKRQFVSGSYGGAFEVSLSNAGDPAGNAGTINSIDDPVGGNVLTGSTSNSSASVAIPSFFAAPTVGPAFANQGAAYSQYGALRLTSIRTGAGDSRAVNDTLRTIYRIDSVQALDDAVSDFGYGLTTPRAFCQKYEIDHPDTLVAIWIHFAPTIYYNSTSGQSNSLEGKGFRLVVWDSLSVDSSLVETSGGMNVSYGGSANEFVRYQLIREVGVPTTFYVGLRQVDGWPIGVGFDKNSTEQRIYFENNLAEFQLSTNIGALMIRPEFRATPGPLAASEAQVLEAPNFQIVPHPVRGNSIGLRLEEFESLNSLELELRDLSGRLIQKWELSQVERELNLELLQNPSAGMYLLQMNAKDRKGQVRSGIQKVMIGLE